MSATADEPRSSARLSPFVFPSDTTFRFALLVVAVLGANLYVWNWLWIAYGSDRREVLLQYAQCETINPGTDIRSVDLDVGEAARSAYTACIADVTRPLAWWMVAGTALLLAAAAVIALVFPRWILRRRRLRPLTRDAAPAVVDELGRLSDEAGLGDEPRWVWNPLDPSPTGLAFGRPGRHSVALMGGLVTRQIADPPAFRAVVRHELAHLRNRDVDLTYATLSLWYAFLLVGVLPFAVVVADEGVDTVLALGWRLLALTALVYLTRNAVLRAREIYADVRASVADGKEGALRRILAGIPRRATSAWRRVWRVHPDPRARLAAVDDTRGLFRLGMLVAFGTGVAATIAYDSIVTFVGLYVRDGLEVRLIAAAPVAPLVLGVVGIGVWRSVWRSLADDRPRSSIWPPALALAAGFLVGPQLALERAVRPEGTTTLLESAFGEGAPWIVLLAAALALALAWVGASAESWIRARAGGKRPARTAMLALVLASGVLATFIAVFNYARETRSAIGRFAAVDHPAAADVAWVGPEWLWAGVQDLWLYSVLRVPVIFLALVALWVLPLAAWLRRRAQVSEASWAFLDEGGTLRTRVLEPAWLRPWLIGLIAGVVWISAVVVLRAGAHAGIDESTRLEFGFAAAFSYWQLMLALGAQTAAAIVAAARAPRMPIVYALAAAFTTGVVVTAGIDLLPNLASCVEPISLRPSPCSFEVDPGGAWFDLRLVTGEGALFAIAGGLAAVGVRAVLERLRALVAPAHAESPAAEV